ncbi:MAG: hypothetical protein ACR2HC_04620 [Thermoleophilaceae bacterium]
MSLLRAHLNGYGYQALDPGESRRWERAFEEGREDAYCELFGPDKIPDEIGSFLGYFMVRKVIAGADLLKAAGTVTKKLARWLRDEGHIDDAAAADTSDQAADASRDLPRASRLTDLLTETSMRTPAFDSDDDTVIEDSLPITRIEPAKLWFGGHGPIDVPRGASDLAQIGWEAWVVLAHQGGRWWLLENGIVYA